MSKKSLSLWFVVSCHDTISSVPTIPKATHRIITTIITTHITITTIIIIIIFTMMMMMMMMMLEGCYHYHFRTVYVTSFRTTDK
jgi:hypothetical protein